MELKNTMQGENITRKDFENKKNEVFEIFEKDEKLTKEDYLSSNQKCLSFSP